MSEAAEWKVTALFLSLSVGKQHALQKTQNKRLFGPLPNLCLVRATELCMEERLAREQVQSRHEVGSSSLLGRRITESEWGRSFLEQELIRDRIRVIARDARAAD